MSFSEILFNNVKGVGSIELKLVAEKKVHAFIGENGVGKTKLLESLFQVLLGSHSILTSLKNPSYSAESLVLASATIDGVDYPFQTTGHFSTQTMFAVAGHDQIKRHSLPIVYMASQNRGFIKHQPQAIQAIGNFKQRRAQYIESLFQGMQQNFAHFNKGDTIEQWFITRAQSSNSYQKQEDNRVTELETVLQLLHQIEPRIDARFLEISGDHRVSLKIKGDKRQLSQLSTGFAAILKIMQSIVSGYGNFTNETQLQQVKGIVLIDEIESHLHLSWQARIIPLLKKLFPNTDFYITTHSSMVLTQLEDGEAYRLQRDQDGVVRSQRITSPNKAAFVDVLKEAFDVDLNQMKQERMSAEQQKAAKKQLLDLLEQKVAKP